MAKKHLLFALLLGSSLACADTPSAPDVELANTAVAEIASVPNIEPASAPNIELASAEAIQSTHAEISRKVDEDGFTRPLEMLTFVPGKDSDNYDNTIANPLDVYDPLESINRRIYHFNYHADQYVMLPAVRFYKYVTPEVVRTGVSNFFSNLGDVGNLINSALQVKIKKSVRITSRLLLNTTLGVFGLWDPATSMGLPKEKEDFGTTLGHYGVTEGPFIVLPLLGPSNLRDTAGLVVGHEVDSGIDFLHVPTESGRHPEIIVLRAIDTRYTTPFRYGQLDTPFEYLKVRYLYTAMRKLRINSND